MDLKCVLVWWKMEGDKCIKSIIDYHDTHLSIPSIRHDVPTGYFLFNFHEVNKWDTKKLTENVLKKEPGYNRQASTPD